MPYLAFINFIIIFDITISFLCICGNIPISASSYTSGLVCGTAWIPTHISVFPIGNNKQFDYHVSGVEEWRLLGKLIFTRGMGFEGTINIE